MNRAGGNNSKSFSAQDLNPRDDFLKNMQVKKGCLVGIRDETMAVCWMVCLNNRRQRRCRLAQVGQYDFPGGIPNRAILESNFFQREYLGVPRIGAEYNFQRLRGRQQMGWTPAGIYFAIRPVIIPRADDDFSSDSLKD